jgi:pimeloyl-ACP methyl ester carboxylesterase
VNLSVERRHLTIGHRTLSYLAAGPRSGARTVVLLHAFPLNAAMWVSQLRALPDGWTGLAPDFRGFGASAPDDEDASRDAARIEDYADDVIAMLDEIGASRAALCGCSMGGYAAFAVLRRAPARVAGLLLSDTRAAADTDAARASRAAMLDVVDRDGPVAIAAEMRPKLVGPTTRQERPDVLAAVDTLMDHATARGIGFAVARMRNRPDATADLVAYLGPVSVVVGEEDTLTPHPEAAAMAAAVPGAEFARIAGAGHLPNLEVPEAFNVAMHGWLRAVDSVEVGHPNPQSPIPNPSREC